MKESITVKPDKTRLINLIEEIAEGGIKIPIFQRDFVWNANQMIELFDSIVKGYPIGSLLFWKPESVFDTKDSIGPYRIVSNNIDVAYVLDGFQRITTLFSVLINPKRFVGQDQNADLKDFLIYYNLKEKEFTYLKSKKDKQSYLIPLYKVVDTYEFIDFLRELEKEIPDKSESNYLIENAKQLSKILYDYEIPFVEIRGGDIKSAVQIFSRINSTGTEISEDFMLSALSYNQRTNFLFSNAITEFLISLGPYNFESLKRDTVLSCISNSKGRIYFDVKIEELLSPDLEVLAYNAFDHIRKAVAFLYEKVGVIDLRLLPYPTQLIFISEYFRLNPNPTQKDHEKLEKWFWVTSYANYFTIYSLSQQRSAYKTFCDFALGLHSDGIYKVNPEERFTAAEFPEKLNYFGVRAKVLRLFILKQLYSLTTNQHNETVKEIFVSGKKDRSVANIILRLASEFEQSNSEKDAHSFLLNSSIEKLSKYFIDARVQDYYRENRIDDFISARERLIKYAEKAFVESFGIVYPISFTFDFFDEESPF